MFKLSDTQKSFLVIFSVFSLVVVSTYFITLFARGYRYDFKSGSGVKVTGLLSATSKPKSASVYINDRLFTATDDTINLPPGPYDIKIVKDGFLPWQKSIVIKKEVVFQTDAQLYRSVADLKPITYSGAINPSVNPDQSKVIYAVASASASRDNGLYSLDLTDSPLPINTSKAKLISPNYPGIDWSKFTFQFSPNSRQLLATNTQTNVNYLLNLDYPVAQNSLYDVTPRLPLIKEDWDAQAKVLLSSKIDRLPKELRAFVATDSASTLSYSSADDKVLYLAAADGSLPDHLIPAPPAQSTQPQNRTLKSGNYYVYDIKDDTNFFLGSPDQISSPTWIPNSQSILYLEGQSIRVTDYDNTNRQTLFAGNFAADSVFPWPDGSRLVVLYSPYEGAPYNLYTISIR